MLWFPFHLVCLPLLPQNFGPDRGSLHRGERAYDQNNCITHRTFLRSRHQYKYREYCREQRRGHPRKGCHTFGIKVSQGSQLRSWTGSACTTYTRPTGRQTREGLGRLKIATRNYVVNSSLILIFQTIFTFIFVWLIAICL